MSSGMLHVDTKACLVEGLAVLDRQHIFALVFETERLGYIPSLDSFSSSNQTDLCTLILSDFLRPFTFYFC